MKNKNVLKQAMAVITCVIAIAHRCYLPKYFYLLVTKGRLVWPPWIEYITHLSHLATVLNSSGISAMSNKNREALFFLFKLL